MKKRIRKIAPPCGRIDRQRKYHSVTFFAVIVFSAVTLAAIRSTALRIVIIGDSTAYTYTAADSLRGWGQELGFFFNKGAVTVINKAIGGRSSRSFIEDGHWASVKALLQKGDILLISFGTNDRGTVPERHADTAQFRQYLTQYVTEARALGVIPVLISTVNQNSWSGTTFTRGFTIGANDYCGAMLRVVDAFKVPFIDLERKSAALFRSLGQAYLADFFFIAGNTHFQEMGAVNIAKLVAEGLNELSADPDVGRLSAVLAPQYMVNVASNKADGGMVTAGGTYPPGAPITLKAIPNKGQTFQLWADAEGKSLTTNKHYAFTMGDSEMSYTARFQGGTMISDGRRASPGGRQDCRIIIKAVSSSGILSVASEEVVKSIHISDVAGRTVKALKPDSRCAAVDLSAFAAGTCLLLISTPDADHARTVHVGK